jgi:hypothetical protein
MIGQGINAGHQKAQEPLEPNSDGTANTPQRDPFE